VRSERLKELLDSGEPFTVMGSQCGHVWPLSDAEVDGLNYLPAFAATLPRRAQPFILIGSLIACLLGALL
jgi:hypothetical protein